MKFHSPCIFKKVQMFDFLLFFPEHLRYDRRQEVICENETTEMFNPLPFSAGPGSAAPPCCFFRPSCSPAVLTRRPGPIFCRRKAGTGSSPGRPSPLCPEFSGSDGYLRVHFIDVGQGDSILIQAGEHAMLVDAGTNESGGTVTDYLHSLNLTKLDYLIGTHPHEDHIGGLDDVILSFDIGTVIMPDVSHTTRTYEDVLDALLEKNLTVSSPQPGEVFSLGDASLPFCLPLRKSRRKRRKPATSITCPWGSVWFTAPPPSSCAATRKASLKKLWCKAAFP